MKGESEGVQETIIYIGVIIISFSALYFMANISSMGAGAQRSVEQGSIIYVIASASSALSSVESGAVSRHLSNFYDIDIGCDNACYIRVTLYSSKGERQEESKRVMMLGGVEPVNLEYVNIITLTKHPDGRIVLTGERTEQPAGSPSGATCPVSTTSKRLCLSSQNQEYVQLIKEASQKYDVPEELIAATIQAESSWISSNYRYEPGYQIKYVEGNKALESDEAWLDEGITIREWFAQNPQRINESKNLTEEQLDLVAQTRISASYGLMQIMYPTAISSCGYSGNPEGLKDPRTNIMCGTKYLKDKLTKYKETKCPVANAVSAYNAGSSSWENVNGNILYTTRVLGYQEAFKSCQA